MDAPRLWKLRVGVEASTRYHELRRARLETWASLLRLLTILGAVLSFLAVTKWLPLSVYEITIEPDKVIVLANAAIAVFALLDLVFGIDRLARLHTDLYRRFKELQAAIARGQQEWERHVDDWEADAQNIRTDEPTTYYALYAQCWNSAIERYGGDVGVYGRKVGPLQNRLRHLRKYQPKDFRQGT